MRLRLCSLLLLFMAVSIEGCSNVNGQSENGDESTCKKILIYNPYIGYYHTKFMGTIANMLHDAGHHVTMLDSLVDASLTRVERRSGITIVEVTQNTLTAGFLERSLSKGEGLAGFWEDLPLMRKFVGLFAYYQRDINFSEMLKYQCDDTLHSAAFKDLKSTKFDLVITEVFDLCGLGLFHLLKYPKRVMLASSVPLHEHLAEKLGLPKSFDTAPSRFLLSTSPSHRSNFDEFDRRSFVENAISSAIWGHNMFGNLEVAELEIFRKMDASFPEFEKLLRGAHSLLENVHPLLDLSKPTLNSIIPIGGITVGKKKLGDDKKIRSILETAKANGKHRVLVSFGTVMNLSTMKEKNRENVITALSQVKDAEFLWMVDPDLVSEEIKAMEVKNVHPFNWLPQSELLASNEIDLFVSHMGIGSFTEAAYNGVPLVSLPLFVDQHYNYACAKRLGIAQFVDKDSVAKSPDMLRDVIQQSLEDENMKANSTQLRANLKEFGDQEMKLMNEIKFVLSLPANHSSTAFYNHHHGFSFWLSIRSLSHLIPNYVVTIMWIAVFACFILFSMVCLLFRQCSKKTSGAVDIYVVTKHTIVFYVGISTLIFVLSKITSFTLLLFSKWPIYGYLTVVVFTVLAGVLIPSSIYCMARSKPFVINALISYLYRMSLSEPFCSVIMLTVCLSLIFLVNILIVFIYYWLSSGISTYLYF